MRRLFLLLAKAVFVSTVALTSAEAQDPGARQSPVPPHDDTPRSSSRFRSIANAVVVDVCVTARDGSFVPALSADDFLVLGDNRPQDVIFFAGEEKLPVAVTMLIDRSGSMRGPKLDAAEAAAISFIDTLRERDLVEVIAFNDQLSTLFPLASEHDAAKQSVSGLSGTGSTRLWDAVIFGLRDLQRGQRHRETRYRQIIVILSDGDDEKSSVSFDYVLDDVRRSGVIVYAVSFRTDERNRGLAAPRELAQLAFDSGGRAVAVDSPASLAQVYREVAAEIRSLYQIGFVPNDLSDDGQWRSISVRVPGRDVHVRARSGYYPAQRPLP
jgi:Ca-activated chloride channel family protein